MEQTIAQLPDSVKVLIIFALGWFFTQWWNDKRQHSKDQDEALNKNTMALIELQIQIKNLTEIISILPRLRADLDVAHSKIRALEKADDDGK